jgi:hypothetical protein
MGFDNRHYVPCLKWKQGEYLGVEKLARKALRAITPLIEVPAIGYDFAEGRESKSIDDHLQKFAGRVRGKWGISPCFVDTHRIGHHEAMASGEHPLAFILDELRVRRCRAVPVVGLERVPGHAEAVQDAVVRDGNGICLRLAIHQLERRGFAAEVEAVLSAYGVTEEESDLILDLGAPQGYEPLEDFSKAVTAHFCRLPRLPSWRTVALLGTSFPTSVGVVKTSPAYLPRYEWMLYREVVASLAARGVRLPTFGDYAISHPGGEEMDWRKFSPATKVRYTIDDAWLIVKGRSARKHGFEQYRDHCRTIVSSPDYMGREFSFADEYIMACASGSVSCGNLPMWVKLDVNHHLTKVVQDIANLFGS